MKRTAKRDPLVLVMQRARKDPQFFHELVFNPKKAIAKVSFLDRASKAQLQKVRGQAILDALVGIGAACSNSCVSGTCSSTCTGNSCTQTCIGSCTATIVTDQIKIDPSRFVSIQTIPARISRRLRTIRK
jgi:hypothetical protein